MSNLDMSLDDMIKMNKKSKGGGSNPRPRTRNSGPGPSRRFPNRSASRSTPYTIGKVEAPDTTWGHDMFEGDAEAYPVRSERVSSIETGTKLLITNLDYGVSTEDIKELFSEVGDVKRFLIHYDRSGRSKGTAEVVFSRQKDAEVAVKKYSNVQLDGKPMKIEIVGTNTPTAAAALATNFVYGNRNGAPRSGQRRGGVMGRLEVGNRPTRGRGRGRGRGEKFEVSAKDLDADLEKYHADNMQTN